MPPQVAGEGGAAAARTVQSAQRDESWQRAELARAKQWRKPTGITCVCVCVCVCSNIRANTELRARQVGFPCRHTVRTERLMHGCPLHLFHSVARLDCPFQGLVACRNRRSRPLQRTSTVLHQVRSAFHRGNRGGMGKGDIRSKRGKIVRGTFGNARKRKKNQGKGGKKN